VGAVSLQPRHAALTNRFIEGKFRNPKSTFRMYLVAAVVKNRRKNVANGVVNGNARFRGFFLIIQTNCRVARLIGLACKLL
jgi:hypothetical protein